VHGVVLSILRAALIAWVAIALFFVTLVIELRQWPHIADEAKLEHPKVLFPVYYLFEFSLMIPAILCSGAALWNERLSRGRRIAMLQLVVVAMALAVWDYGLIYQRLVELMAAGPPPFPPEFHTLHRMSRRLNEAMVVACFVAAILALIPQRSRITPPSASS
jgi:hypothetical protein